MKAVQKAKQNKGSAGAARAKAELKLAPPGRCNGLSLRKATRRISQLYDLALTPCGLRSTQRSILIQIARMGEAGMGELADALVLDRSALAHNLKPLERDGFVETIVDPNDGRARLAALTDAGRAKIVESQPLWENAQRCFEKAFGVRNAEALRTSLAFLASPEFAKAFERAEAAFKYLPGMSNETGHVGHAASSESSVSCQPIVPSLALRRSTCGGWPRRAERRGASDRDH